MVAWMVYYREAAEYNKSYIGFYQDEGVKLGIDVKLILVEELEFGVKDNGWFMEYQKKTITFPDFVICRAIYPILSRQFEVMGIPVFNNSFVSEICNDKARTYQYLAGTGIKMIDSSFYRSFQVKDVLAGVDKLSVMKAVEGHGGKQVFLVEPAEKGHISAESDQKTALSQRDGKDIDIRTGLQSKDIPEADRTDQDIIKGLEGSDVVLQPFTGNRHQDLRVYVIGDEIIAAVLRTARKGFKSNFSLGGDVRLYQLSEEEKQIIKIIIDQFDFGLVGIDFIIGDRGELIFNEIEDVVGSRMLYQCSDINIAEKYLLFILNNIQRGTGSS